METFSRQLGVNLSFLDDNFVLNGDVFKLLVTNMQNMKENCECLMHITTKISVASMSGLEFCHTWDIISVTSLHKCAIKNKTFLFWQISCHE